MYIYVDQRTLHTRRPVPEGPLLGRSALTELACSVSFRGFGIKYVERGVERYTVNGRELPVRSGQYVLVNTQCMGSVVIDSAQTVEGLCVQLPERMLDEVVAANTHPGALDEEVRPGYFSEALELQVRPGAITRVGSLMEELLADPLNRSSSSRPLSEELYFRIAEALLIDHRADLRGLGRVAAVKTDTRREILRRVERARAMMHDRAKEALTIAACAREAAMSEYHFSRAFRTIHGRSPYQYLLEVRMRKALVLLSTTDQAVADIAVACGHEDPHAFSKAFKRVMGAAPSTFRGSSRN